MTGLSLSRPMDSCCRFSTFRTSPSVRQKLLLASGAISCSPAPPFSAISAVRWEVLASCSVPTSVRLLYTHTTCGCGFPPVNADILSHLLAFLPSLPKLWVVAGDWNSTIQELLATRLEVAAHGRFVGCGFRVQLSLCPFELQP